MWAEPVGRFSSRYNNLQRSLDGCGEWAAAWKMKWSSDKSNIVCFTKKKQLREPIPTFRLGSIALSEVKQYTYLGLTLQSDGKWDQQFNRITKKASYSSYLISRVIQKYGPPTPATIRQLTIAIPRARLLWALPFWLPNKTQFTAMDRILTLPLRSALRLPRCTSRAALFAEYGLANMELTREYQQLAYANRILTQDQLQTPNPAYSLLMASSVSLPTGQVHSKTFWEQLYYLQTGWNVNLHTTCGSELKQQMIQKQLQFYRLTPPSTSSLGLRPYKSEPGASLYLYLDPKPVAVMRARLRFDLASFCGSVMGLRMGIAAEPCKLCGMTGFDTRDHLLLHCPSLLHERDKLILDMVSERRGHLVNTDSALIQFLLGNLSSADRGSDQNRDDLKRSGQFIKVVFGSRYVNSQQQNQLADSGDI